jgi:protocatechuate 3,4-dioxygenase beta subunit
MIHTKAMKRFALVLIVAALGVVLWLAFRRSAHSTLPTAPPTAARAPTAPWIAKRPAGRGDDAVLALDDGAKGDQRLEGQVIDADDQPVGGALVVINGQRPRTTTSEADGSFHFEGLRDRPYTLIARAPGGVAGPVTARPTPGEPVILRLAAGGSLEVVVRSAASRAPVPEAAVQLVGLVERAVSDATGTATLRNIPPGSFQLVARAPGYAPRHAWVDVAPGSTKTTVRIALSAGAAVDGRVLGEADRPIAGALVLYQGVSDWGQQAHAQLDGVVTGSDGRWHIDALPAGTFRFEARAAGFAPGSSEAVLLDGMTPRGGLTVRVTPGAVVRGRVEDLTHKPVVGARVRIAVASAGHAVWRAPRETFSDDAGRFELAELPRQPLELVALDGTGASSAVAVDLSRAPAEREVVLTLDLTALIAGTVVDAAGQPLDGAHVVAHPNADLPDSERQLRGPAETGTDSAGHFALRGLKPGTYVLRAQRSGAVARSRSSLAKGTPARTGQDDIRLVVETGGGMRGNVALETGGAPLAFTIVLGADSATPFTAGDGRFQLIDVPARSYRVTIRGVGFAAIELTVDVKPGAIAELGTIIVHKGRTVSGRVVRDGKPVADAVVVAGRALFGSGSTTQASVGAGRADNAKETTTDGNGEFTLNGVGAGDLNLVAEHPDHGRSRTQAIRFNREPIEGLELVLLPFAAITGKVLRGGAPVEGVFVNAQSTSAPGAIYGVATGPDGRFRFDRLAPDSYKVSAVTGDPRTGLGFHSAAVTLAPGQTATVNLSLDAGNVTLKVTPRASNAPTTGFAIVFATDQPVAPRTARELESIFATLGEAFTGFGLAINGSAAVLKDLEPGSYTVCSWVFPNETRTRPEIQAYGEREGDNLKVFCSAVVVAPTPAEQAFELTVEVPAFIPLTQDTP